jgi:hypothetical protein
MARGTSKARSAYLDKRIGLNRNASSATVIPFGRTLRQRVVSDPHDGKLTRVLANVRGDSLGELLGNSKIRPHQFVAGRELEATFARNSTNGSVKSVDFAREPVSGGSARGDRYSDARRGAGNAIAGIKATLGEPAFKLLAWLLQDGLSIDDVAAKLQCDRRFVVVRVREALEKLARAGGHVGAGPERGKVFDKHSRAAAEVARGERGAKAAA